jgi:hypothetical protein
MANGQTLAELIISGSYGSLPVYAYVGYTYTHGHISVTPSLAAHHAAVLTSGEITALFNGQPTIRLSRLQEAEVQKIHRELKPGAPPLPFGVVRNANGDAQYDSEGWAIPDSPTVEYQQGRTIVWPADFLAPESRMYWNLTTPAVSAYIIRYAHKLQSLNRHARLFVDEGGTYGEDLFLRDHVAPGSLTEKMDHVANRLNAINRAIKTRRDPAGRVNQGIIFNSGFRRTDWTSTFWNHWYQTLSSNKDTFDGLMAESLWFEDGWATDVPYYRDKIVELNKAGKQLLFVATDYTFLKTADHPLLDKIWLWLHLVAQAPTTYLYLNPHGHEDMIDYAVYSKPLGSPLEAPYRNGNTWRRKYQNGEIVFDITSGSIDAIQLVPLNTLPPPPPSPQAPPPPTNIRLFRLNTNSDADRP